MHPSWPRLAWVKLSRAGTKVCLTCTAEHRVSHWEVSIGVPQLSLGEKAVLTATPDYVRFPLITPRNNTNLESTGIRSSWFPTRHPTGQHSSVRSRTVEDKFHFCMITLFILLYTLISIGVYLWIFYTDFLGTCMTLYRRDIYDRRLVNALMGSNELWLSVRVAGWLRCSPIL